MATLTNAFRINGVVDTSRPVLENLNELCNAVGCWMSYDITTGLWSVVINRTGSSTKSFDDSNIIGSINVTGTGIREAYNKASIEFPHKDLRDQTDYIDLAIPLEDLYPNEIENTLNLSSNLINDPVQAQYIATVELKQSRVDRIVEFRTDYSSLGLRAGDLIDITADMYGWTNKVFRVITVNEADTDDGVIELSVTALEYSADVYDTSGLVRETRSKKTGIIPKAANSAVVNNDNAANTSSVANALLDPTNAAVLALLMNALTRSGSAVGLTPTVNTFITSLIHATVATGTPTEISLGFSTTLPYTGYYKTTYSINWGGAGSPGATGVLKNSTIILKTGGTTFNDTGLATTGDGNVQLFEDHFLDSIYYGVQGQVVNFYFEYATDWGGDYGGNGGAGTYAMFLINAETKFVGR